MYTLLNFLSQFSNSFQELLSIDIVGENNTRSFTTKLPPA